MRITFLLPTVDLTGGCRVVSVYARMLRDAGHTVVVVVAGPRKETIRDRMLTLVGVRQRIPADTSRRSHFDGLGLDVRHMESYRPVLDADVPDADVIVATWWETAEWVWPLARSKGAKVHFVQGHEIFPGMPLHRVVATYRLPIRKIVVSNWLRELMRVEYGIDEVDLVCNGVDANEFYAEPRSRQPRPTVGFMSSSAEFKGVDVAVRVISEVKRSVSELRVISFGYMRVEGLEFLGADLEFYLRPDQKLIRECYSRCDAWLTSSRSEGFNLTALEAMRCRTPVVSTRTGWPAESVSSGRNGYLTDIDDSHGLVAGVTRILLADPESWRAMSECAFETARPLTWDQSFPRFEAALDRVSRVSYVNNTDGSQPT